MSKKDEALEIARKIAVEWEMGVFVEDLMNQLSAKFWEITWEENRDNYERLEECTIQHGLKHM